MLFSIQIMKRPASLQVESFHLQMILSIKNKNWFHFYMAYGNLYGGVADNYAFSRFHDNAGIRDLPAVRHFKSADAVVEDHAPLIGNAVLLDRRINVNVVDQFADHAFGNRDSVGIEPDRSKKNGGWQADTCHPPEQ